MSSDSANSPAGYAALQLQRRPPPHFRSSYIASGARKTLIENGRELHYYPSSYRPADGLGGQLEFALKYDGVNLQFLKQLFLECDKQELTQWIANKKSGIYTRRAWFFYEWLTGDELDLPNLTSSTYIDALDDRYLRGAPVNSKRHRVRNNLLGTAQFCPVVRHSDALKAFSQRGLAQRATEIVAGYAPEALHRAAQFLYLKETKSSFQIEREQPTQSRSVRFVELLRAGEQAAEITPEALVELQNAIVDPRYAETAYRKSQNYVGQTLPGLREVVHFISPRPQDVESLMQGLLECHARVGATEIDPVARAAVIAFGFVFIHPFEDGNGRIHRYLIHHALSHAGFSPRGVILPVSATMLAHPAEYDRALETFSKPLLQELEYDLTASGEMTVHDDTADYYRYFDATPLVEYLYQTLELTIDEELRNELEYLAKYDKARRALQETVDLPDRKLDLFIRLCLDGNGRLSSKKRQRQFAELSDEEVTALESLLSEAMQPE